MGKDVAQFVCEHLESEFKKKFPPAGLKLVIKDLVAASDKSLEKAFDHFVLSNRFPSPDQLRERVMFEGKLILAAESRERESEWHKQKGGATRQELDKQPNIFNSQQATEYGRRAVIALKLTVNPDIPRKTVVEEILQMDRDYPGRGYGNVAEELRQKWGVRASSDSHAVNASS